MVFPVIASSESTSPAPDSPDAPRPGRYAIAVGHDENGNRTLDTAVTGLPAQGCGLSSNPRIWFRRPRLADTAFTVDPAQPAVDTDLRY
jgi:uncharacterized protein (DUF2141 family)